MENLKSQFALSLKKMLMKKTLDKITITDIVNDCGVSRQAFYYHFSDIYNIVEWIFIQETENALRNHQDINTWQTGYCNLLYWLRDNKTLVTNTYKSVQREYVENFMYNVLFDHIFRVVEAQSEGMFIDKPQKEFVAKFFTLAFNSIGLDWIHEGMKENPEKVVKRIDILIKGDFKKALENMEAENINNRLKLQ